MFARLNAPDHHSMADRLNETSLHDSPGSVETGTIGSTVQHCVDWRRGYILPFCPSRRIVSDPDSRVFGDRLFEPGEIRITYLGNAG